MKVILNQTVDSLGEEGDVVAVKDGFARNYLLPKEIAKNATKNNITLMTIIFSSTFSLAYLYFN